jgi:DNA polymerase-1
MTDLGEGIELHYVETVEEAATFLTWLGERRPILSIDTETTGLEWWTPNFTRLVQFGDGMTGWTISVERWRGLADIAMSKVVSDRVPVAFHNAGFDMHALTSAGFETPLWSNVHDTLVMDHLSYPIQSHGLKPIARRKWGPWAVVGQQMLADHFKKAGVWWDTVSLDEPTYTTYAAMDTVLTARLAKDLGTSLSQRGLLPAYDREMAAKAVLWRAERRGMSIYTDYAVGLRAQWQARLMDLSIQLDAWGVDNPNSKASVVAALKRKEGWDPEEFTETGEPVLTKATLNGLEGSKIAPLVIEYKRKTKWIGSYLDHFIDNQTADGRVHPSINTLAARTGRMSITNPALQTLPSKEASIRHCIKPDEGHHFWAIDYNAQELRVMAHKSNDPGLLQLFRENLDPHSYVASVVYGLPYEELLAGQHKVQRGTAKNTQFARLYGAGAETIAATAGVPVGQIEEFLRIYDARFPGVSRHMKDVETTAKNRLINEGEPYITTQYGRWINVEPDKLYALVNYEIQGECADLLKDKIVLADKCGFGDNIVLPAHDEIITQFPVGEVDGPRELTKLMEEHDRYSIPLTCEATGPLATWGGAYV